MTRAARIGPLTAPLTAPEDVDDGRCQDCGEHPGEDGALWKRRRVCVECAGRVCPSCYHHQHARAVAQRRKP